MRPLQLRAMLDSSHLTVKQSVCLNKPVLEAGAIRLKYIRNDWTTTLKPSISIMV